MAALVSAAIFAGYASTSSATVLCKVQLPECAGGNDLPVPETVSANMTSTAAVFAQTPGASCTVSSLELETTSNLGFWPKPLLAKIISWKFSSCTPCTTVTALTPFEAEFNALQDGSPTNFHGNGNLKIISPKFKLSGCAGGLVCLDSAAAIVLKVSGGSPHMKLIASSATMGVSGTSCVTSPSPMFSAEYSATPKTTKTEGLWLEPVL